MLSCRKDEDKAETVEDPEGERHAYHPLVNDSCQVGDDAKRTY